MALVCLNDMVAYASTFVEHQGCLSFVLKALSRAGLHLQLQECFFGFKEVIYLGHVINKNGVKPDPENLRTFEKYAAPRTLRELQSFQGFASYFHHIIPNLTHHAAPLSQLLKKGAMWCWSEIEQ